jgi:uncharacterized protein GlcG (DUF336 family)
MKLVTSLAVGGVVALSLAASAMAQQATPPYGPISMETALKVVAAAEAEAKKNNWPVVITVVDSGGHIVIVHRLDNTQIASLAVAEGKARTAVVYRRPSKAFEDGLAAGGINLRILTLPQVIAVDGGVPLMVDGKLIGAVGVSGVLAAQDGQIANAGANALK